MKITIELIDPETDRVTSRNIKEIHWSSDIYETVEAIGGVLICSGFHPQSVKDGFQAYLDERAFEDKED